MQPHIRQVVAAVVAFALAGHRPASGQDVDAELDSQIRRSLHVERYELVSLTIQAGDRRPVSINITLDGVPVSLILRPSAVRTADFQVLVADGTGVVRDHPAPPETTYLGEVAEWPGSVAAASIIDGELWARIIVGDAIWAIQPVSKAAGRLDARWHAAYRDEDLLIGSWRCGTNGAVGPAPAVELPRTRSGSGNECEYIAEVAFDADVEYYQYHGSSIPAVVADIESILNAINAIYQQEVLITHLIPRIVVRTAEPDGLTSTDPPTLLSQMRTKWNTEHSPGSADPIARDMAHLMTGKNLNNPIIGYAYIAVVCSSLTTGSGYGLSESHFTGNFSLRVSLTAHELGHNWSANHCNGDADCAIMCSSIGGCTGILDQFGVRSTNSITAHRDTRPCVDEGDPPNADCNVNCIEDADEIALGQAFDCNENGVLDICDVADGLGGDCDGNGILDTCEDCDGNGAADICDLSADLTLASPQLSPFGLGSNALYTFNSLPDPVSDVTISIFVSADIGSVFQSVAIYLNKAFLTSAFNTSGNPGGLCSNPPDLFTLEMSLAEFQTRVPAGTAAFRLEALNSLPFECNNQSFAVIQLDYTTESDVDLNGNGILDLCECDADCAASGPDTLVNVLDLLSLLASWGPGPDACDFAPPGGDGQVDVTDLLALLASWGTCAP